MSNMPKVSDYPFFTYVAIDVPQEEQAEFSCRAAECQSQWIKRYGRDYPHISRDELFEKTARRNFHITIMPFYTKTAELGNVIGQQIIRQLSQYAPFSVCARENTMAVLNRGGVNYAACLVQVADAKEGSAWSQLVEFYQRAGEIVRDTGRGDAVISKDSFVPHISLGKIHVYDGGLSCAECCADMSFVFRLDPEKCLRTHTYRRSVYEPSDHATPAVSAAPMALTTQPGKRVAPRISPDIGPAKRLKPAEVELESLLSMDRREFSAEEIAAMDRRIRKLLTK